MVAKKKTEQGTAAKPAEERRLTHEEELDELLTPASVTLGLEPPAWLDSQEPDAPEYLLGDRIRGLREKLGLTHDGLSELTKIADKAGRGISRTTIRGYELRTYKPGARELRILSLALRVSPSFLIFGEAGDEQSGGAADREKIGSRPRWATVAFPALCYSQLGTDERKQIVGLVETLYRLQIGEVRFRSMKAFVEDFVDTVQDALADRIEQKNLNVDEMRRVLLDTADEMRRRHGDAEADLLMAVLPLLLSPWSG